MKKEEFPTFLNEQPTVVFGRNMRELMVILVGLGLSYAAWTNLGLLLPEPGIGIIALKVLSVIAILIATFVVAFIKIASRPLEEWALVGIFYQFTPKVFVYMPFDDNKGPNGSGGGDEMMQVQSGKDSATMDDSFN